MKERMVYNFIVLLAAIYWVISTIIDLALACFAWLYFWWEDRFGN